MSITQILTSSLSPFLSATLASGNSRAKNFKILLITSAKRWKKKTERKQNKNKKKNSVC